LLGDIPLALDYFQKCLIIAEQANNKMIKATTLSNLAYIYLVEKDYDKALEYYLKSLGISKIISDKQGETNTLLNVGSIYSNQNDYKTAMYYFKKSLSLSEEIKYEHGIAAALTNIGYVHEMRGNFKEALSCYLKGLELRKGMKNTLGISNSMGNIAATMLKTGQINEACVYGKKSLEIAEKLGYPHNIERSAATLREIYVKLGKYSEAIKLFDLEIQMGDSSKNEVTRKATVKKQFQMEYEKEALKDSVVNVAKMNKEKIKHEQEITRQRTYTYGGFAGLALMFVVAGVSFRAFKNKQKSNNIITEQKLFAEMQKHIIEEKQKEIIDSINYAKRIQKAQLPTEKYIMRRLESLRNKD